MSEEINFEDPLSVRPVAPLLNYHQSRITSLAGSLIKDSAKEFMRKITENEEDGDEWVMLQAHPKESESQKRGLDSHYSLS